MTTKTPDELVIVDQEDLKLLDNYKWYLAHGYVSRQLNINGKQYQQRLHREILGIEPYEKVQVDHINGNKLDNRRKNLRVCKRIENIRNRGVFKNNKIGLKGVSFKKSNKKFVSQIQYDGKVYHLGMFLDPENAAYVYDQFAIQLFGKFARTNLL